MTHYREPKALRMHCEQLEKGIRRDAQRDAAERGRLRAEENRRHQEALRALEANVVTSAIKAQQR